MAIRSASPPSASSVHHGFELLRRVEREERGKGAKGKKEEGRKLRKKQEGKHRK
jgi:hypothetical protein